MTGAQGTQGFAVGSLVRACGKEWVLPESEGEMLVLRPLGGTEDEVTGVYLPLEDVEPATFDMPDPEKVGDFLSARVLPDERAGELLGAEPEPKLPPDVLGVYVYLPPKGGP